MLIGVYGISRVGKDHFISEIVAKSNANMKHISGSYHLAVLAKEIYQKDFVLLNQEEKKLVREKFTSKVKLEENSYLVIFVDGHYSFPKEDNDFEVVITQDDIDLYDVFIYLDKSSESIYSNSINDKKHFSKFLMNIENIDKWKKFDKSGLKYVVESNNKKWIVINEFYDYSSQFFIDFFSNYEMFDTRKIINGIIDEIESCNNGKKKVVLLDCDKTLSVNDITISLINEMNYDKNILKKIFSGDDYTDYQFYNLQKYITQSGSYTNSIKNAIKNQEYNNKLLENLSSLKNTTKIALTTGVGDAWYEINKQKHIFDFLVGKGLSKDYFNFYVTSKFKEEFTLALLVRGYTVTAVGDSIIDIGMLERADKGILVSMLKLDKRIVEYFDKNPNSKITQFSNNLYKYSGVKEVNEI